MSRLALVTGSTSGLGLEIAKILAKDGFQLIINGFDTPEIIAKALTEIESLGSPAPLFVGTDLRNVVAIENVLADIISTYGTISVLINHADIQYRELIDEFSVDQWDQIIALHLNASFHTTRLCLPRMRDQNFGRIINIASLQGLNAAKKNSAYVAAKHGLIGLSKVTALETADSNITCNVICPSYTHADLIEVQIERRAQQMNINDFDGWNDLLMDHSSTPSFVTTNQLGALISFLCSEKSSEITGVSFPIGSD